MFQQYKASIARIFGKNGNVVGAGFLVSSRTLLTCAHVVNAALFRYESVTEQPEEDQIIAIDFPLIARGIRVNAQVIAWYPEGKVPGIEDIAGLKLLTPPPENVQAVQVITVSDFEKGRSLSLFGFPEGHADGVTASVISRMGNGKGWVQLDGAGTEGYAIMPGFSGSPVWDEKDEAVVGMTVARDQEHETAKVGFMIPKKGLLPALKVLTAEDLVEILITDEPAIKRALFRAYDLCRSPGGRQSSPTDLRQLIQRLTQQSEGITSLSPLQRFVGCLIYLLTDSRAIVEKLTRWLEVNSDEPQRVLDWAAGRVEEVRRGAVGQDRQAEAYLFIDVKPKPQNPGKYFINAWFISNMQDYNPASEEGIQALVTQQEAFSPIDLPGQVQSYLDQILCDDCQPLVEVFLPFELLNHAVDRWEQRDDFDLTIPIGSEYPIVVRSRERLTPRYQKYKQKWQDQWTRLKNNYQALVCPLLTERDDRTIEQLAATLFDPRFIGLKMTAPPGTQQPNELSALLRAGSPVAIWLRRSLTCCEEIEAVLNCRVQELVEQVKEKRRSDFAEAGVAQDNENDRIGHHLSLLWENFDHQLPKTYLSNSQL